MLDQERIRRVQERVEQFRQEQWARHRVNFFANWMLVFLALASAIGAIVGGALKWPHEAIILVGVVGTAAVGLQKAYGTELKAEFERSLVAEAENLLLYLEDSELTEDDFRRHRDAFAVLVQRAGSKLPPGEGIAAVQQIRAGAGAGQ